MPHAAAIRKSLIVLMALVAIPAEVPAQRRDSQADAPPMLIKFYRDHDDKLKKQKEAEALRARAEEDYVKARQAATSAVAPDDQRAAREQQQAANDNLNSATTSATNAQNAVAQTEAEAADQGYSLNGSPEGQAAPAIGPKFPMNHTIEGGSLFRQLRDQMEPDLRRDPTAATVYYDGARRRSAETPAPTIDRIMRNRREIAEQEANIRKAIAEEEANRRQFEEEQGPRIAAAQTDAKNSAQLTKLIEEINAHVDDAQNVDPNDDVQIRNYNAKSDRLYYRYKQLTGQDLGYRYKQIR